jgi:hypothetical protein
LQWRDIFGVGHYFFSNAVHLDSAKCRGQEVSRFNREKNEENLTVFFDGAQWSCLMKNAFF